MKKIISLGLVFVLVFGLTAISFADKPEWANKKNVGLPNGLAKKEVLPYGLAKRESLPFGLLRMQIEEDITEEDIFALINDITEYIEDIDEDAIENCTIIDAINNLFDKVDYELLNEEPEFNDLFYLLTKKFEILKKQAEIEIIDYIEELNEIKGSLEDEEIDEDIEEGINNLINEINSLLLEEEITLEEYEAIVEKVEEFLGELDEEVNDLEALIEEVQLFIINNDFGEGIGEYSAEESELIMINLIKYSTNKVEGEGVFYDELLNDFESLKVSKIVDGSYLTKVEDYKTLLKLISKESLSDIEKLKLDNLLKLIDEVLKNEKMTLKEFNSIESQTTEFILNLDYYMAELDNLIDDARTLIIDNPIDLDEIELLSSRTEFLRDLIKVLSLRRDAETIEDYQEAIEFLQEAIDEFQLELDK